MNRSIKSYLALGGFALLAACAAPTGGNNSPTTSSATPLQFRWAGTVSTGAADTAYNAVFYDSTNIRWYAAGWVQGGPSSYDFGDSHAITGMTSANKNAVLVKYEELGAVSWTAVATGTGDIVFTGVAVSGTSVIAVGTMTGTAAHNFGNAKTASGISTGKNAFIVSFSLATGLAQWVWTPKQWGTDPVLESELLAVTASGGSIYAVGDVVGAGAASLDLGTGLATSTTTSGTQGLVVSLDPAALGASARWASVSSGTGGPRFRGVAVDSSGHVDAVGILGPAATLVSFPTTGSNVDATSAGSTFENSIAAQFLATSNATLSGGDCLWITTTASGNVKNRFNAVVTDSADNLYAAGSVDGTAGITFTSGSPSVQGSSSLRSPLLVKLNSSGAVQWAKSTTSGTGPCEFLGVSFDASSGALWTAGAVTYAPAQTFGPGVVFGGPGTDRNPLVVRYSLAGTAMEAHGASDVPTAADFSAVVAAGGKIGMVGTVTGTATSHFGSYANTMPSNTGSNVLMATAW